MARKVTEAERFVVANIDELARRPHSLGLRWQERRDLRSIPLDRLANIQSMLAERGCELSAREFIEILATVSPDNLELSRRIARGRAFQKLAKENPMSAEVARLRARCAELERKLAGCR